MTYLHDEQHRDTTKQITKKNSSSRCTGTRTTVQYKKNHLREVRNL